MKDIKTKLTAWRVLAYFIIYSVLGYILETCFAFVMYGVIESRQSFMYGPFCAIYGIGAVAMIVGLRYFNKNNYTLFVGGYLIGSILEYIISFLGELIIGTRWWDYSHKFLNINGRICLTYSVFWGLLGLYLMNALNPKIDEFIDWIELKLNKVTFRTIVLIIIAFMFVDSVYSALAENWVLTKVIIEKDLNIKDKEKIKQSYDNTYNSESKKAFVDKYWTVEKVLMAYPNLTTFTEDGEKIFVKELYPEIHPYLYKRNIEQKGNIYEQ